MKDAMREKLTLFADNAQVLKREFVWHNAMTKRLAALLYAREGKAVDCGAIRACHEMIKRNTGAFSSFRGDMTLCEAALLSLSDGAQAVLDATLAVYELLRGAKFWGSDFLVVAAHLIAAQAAPADFENRVGRMRAFYDGMKADHFFYTGQDDYIFAAMLSLSDIDVEAGVQRIERFYGQLKDEFRSNNSVQALAQVLVLGGSDEAAVQRVIALRDAVRVSKIKLDKAYTLPVLGVLALLPGEVDGMVRDIADAQAFLKAQKGLGALSVTAQELLLYASSFIAEDTAHGIRDGLLTAALSTSITNIIIAQQTALIAAITAAAAASSSSSG